MGVRDLLAQLGPLSSHILGDNYSAQFQRDILCSAEYEAYLALALYQCDAKDVYICIDSVSSSKRLTGTAVCADSFTIAHRRSVR